MLSVNKYTQEYVDACREEVNRQVATYVDPTTAARDLAPDGNTDLGAAIEAFEPRFFNSMILALDAYFCHRARAMEKKDGNPLNEVRVLCNSIMHNDGRLAADKTIRLDPATSVLKYQVGDPITLDATDFSLLSDAFFAEIEAKYS